jgi:hypothetical protein
MRASDRLLPESAVIQSLTLVLAIVLSAGGCSKADNPRAVASPGSVITPEESRDPSVPKSPDPQVNAAKDAQVQSPPPGQANDHSSPDFKKGGVPDKSR